MACKSCERMIQLASTNINEEIEEQLSLEFDLASEDKKEERLSVCLECPFFQEHTCIKCGCYARFRASLDYKTCPIGKW